MYYGKTWNDNKYIFANVNILWHLIYFAISIFVIMKIITSVNDDILLVFSEWWHHMGSSLVFMHFEDRHAVVCSVVHILPYLFWGSAIRVVATQAHKVVSFLLPVSLRVSDSLEFKRIYMISYQVKVLFRGESLKIQ